MKKLISVLCCVAMLAALLPALPAAAAEPAISDNFESYDVNSRFDSEIFNAQDLPEGGIVSRTIKEEGGNKYLQFMNQNTEESTGTIRNRINTVEAFGDTYTLEFDYKNMGKSMGQLDVYIRDKGNIRVRVREDGLLRISVLDAVKVEGVMESANGTVALENDHWYTLKVSVNDDQLVYEAYDKENGNKLVDSISIVQDTSTAAKLLSDYYIWFDLWGNADTSNTEPVIVAVDNFNITRAAYDGLLNASVAVGGGSSAPSTPSEPTKPSQPATPSTPSTPSKPNESEAGMGIPTHTCPSKNMLDVHKNAWYHLGVDYVLTNNIMSGYNFYTFGPYDTLNRAMVVQVLYNKEGQPAVDVANKFTDVPAGQWYYNAVRWGADKGVVSGFGNGQFRPEDAVTLEQVAVILWNYAGNPAFTGTADGLGAHSSWASNALAWAIENGILADIPFESVTDAANRGQTAMMLMNFLDK